MNAPRRRWFRFSLREVAILMLALGFAMGWISARLDAEAARRDSAQVQEFLERIGVQGTALIDYSTKFTVRGDKAIVELDCELDGIPTHVAITRTGPMICTVRMGNSKAVKKAGSPAPPLSCREPEFGAEYALGNRLHQQGCPALRPQRGFRRYGLLESGSPSDDHRRRRRLVHPIQEQREPSQGSLWAKMHHFFHLNRDEFDARYHQRSNVESTFSMVKAKFGDSVRSKIDVAMENEVLAKLVCHNICCLIQSMHEFGVDPSFWDGEGEAIRPAS